MLRQSFAYLAIRAANGVIALLSLYVLTRLMPSEQYGAYALGLAAISIATAVLFQGLAVAEARAWPAHAASPAALLAEARRIFQWIAALFFAALALFFAALEPVLAWSARWGPPIVAAVFCGAVAMGLHAVELQSANAQGQSRRYAKLTVARAAITLALAAGLVAAGWGAVGALFATALGALAAVAWFGIRRSVSARGIRDPALRYQLLRHAVPLSAVYVAMMVVDQADRLLIGWWFGPSKVAGYAAAYDLAQQSVGAILNVCFLAGFPRVVTSWESGGAEAARHALRPLSRHVMLLAPLAAALSIAFADEITWFMFGSVLHDDAAAAMPWLATAVALLGLRAYVFDVAFHVAKSMRPLLLIAVLMAVVNLGANIALLPGWGVVGAGVASALAAAVGVIASWLAGRRRGIRPPVGMDLLAGLVAAAALVAIARAPWWSTIAAESHPAVVATRVVAGMAAFAVVALACDLCGVRAWLVARRAAARG